MSDPERIWLQPACCAPPGERTWSDADEWPDSPECRARGVEYVRADLARRPPPTRLPAVRAITGDDA